MGIITFCRNHLGRIAFIIPWFSGIITFCRNHLGRIAFIILWFSGLVLSAYLPRATTDYSTTLNYVLSTIAQTFAGLLGFLAAFAVLKLSMIRQVIESEAITLSGYR